MAHAELSKPVIGWTETTTRRNKVITKTMQVRGWELMAGGGLVAAFIAVNFYTGAMTWKEHRYKTFYPTQREEVTTIVWPDGHKTTEKRLKTVWTAKDAVLRLPGANASWKSYNGSPVSQAIADVILPWHLVIRSIPI